MQSTAKTVAAYLSELDPEVRDVIASLDRLICSVLPEAVASMKFGMPTYEVGERMIACNAQKQYFSLYVDPVILSRHKTTLKGLNCGKSCIRFRKAADLPPEKIRAILDEYR